MIAFFLCLCLCLSSCPASYPCSCSCPFSFPCLCPLYYPCSCPPSYSLLVSCLLPLLVSCLLPLLVSCFLLPACVQLPTPARVLLTYQESNLGLSLSLNKFRQLPRLLRVALPAFYQEISCIFRQDPMPMFS